MVEFGSGCGLYPIQIDTVPYMNMGPERQTLGLQKIKLKRLNPMFGIGGCSG
jgi:hypothetical protein